MFGVLDRHGLLRQATPAGAATCDECGETRQVNFLHDRVSEASVGYIACPACGPTRLQPEQLNRLALDTDAMLRHLFCGIRVAVRPVIADRLWQVGRVAIAARSRDCWFLRGLGTRHHAAILQQLATEQHTRDVRRRNELKEQLAKIQAAAPDRPSILAAINNLESLWEHLTMGERSRLMTLLVTSIEHDPSESTLSITLSPTGLKSFATQTSSPNHKLGTA